MVSKSIVENSDAVFAVGKSSFLMRFGLPVFGFITGSGAGMISVMYGP
jgi:hypothetical protein